MPDETAPSSVRMPEVKIPFTADFSSIEDALEELKNKITEDLTTAFQSAVAEMERKLGELKDKTGDAMEFNRNPTAGLEGRKEITVDELMMRFGEQRKPATMEEFLGHDPEVRRELAEQTEMLRRIYELLATREED